MIIVKTYLRLSLELLWTVCGSSFSDSSLVRLVLLTVYWALRMQSVLTTGAAIAPVSSKAVPTVYFSFCLLVSSVSNFRPATRGKVVFTFSFFFFVLTCSIVLWGGRNTANNYHWHVLTVIQPHGVSPPLMVCVLPQSTLLRL